MAHHQTATTASGALGIVLAARVPVLLWSAPGTEKTATITRGGHMSVATALSNWLMYRTGKPIQLVENGLSAVQ